MTDQERNIRTLIVCFAIAILVLIPLRFIEVGNSLTSLGSESVLGEVNLPEAGGPEPELESPYREIENQSYECIESDEANVRINRITEIMLNEELGQGEMSSLNNELQDIEKRICK